MSSSSNSNFMAVLFALLAGFVIGVVLPSQTGGDTLRVLNEEEDEEEHEHDPIVDYTVVVVIVLLLIAMTILFEYAKDMAEESCSRHVKPIVESLFGELTVLGFLSIFTFVLSKSKWFMRLGESLFGSNEGEELLEVLEFVHYIIFFIMVFFVFQVLVLVKEANETSHNWLQLEKQVRNTDVDWTERATSFELSSMHMTIRRWIYSYASFIPCCKNQDREEERRLLLYKALRDEFVLDRELDYPFRPASDRIDPDFNFGRYLGLCQASFLQKVVHVKISTWLLFAVGVLGYFIFAVMVHCNRTVLAWTWVVMAWFLCLYNIHFERHLIQVISAFASKGVHYLAHHGDETLESKSTGLLESDTANGDHLLPDWCRIDIDKYLASRSYLSRCFAGGVPNRQQALYWMDRKGPPLYLSILQFDLLFVGIFAAIQCIQVGPYMYSEQPLWAFVLYIILATLPILNIAINKKRLVAVLTPVCSLGFYRRPQLIAEVIREEKTAQCVRTFIVVYKLRRFAMQAEPAKKQPGTQVHYSVVFDKHEIAEVGRTFDEFDLDGSGTITLDEFEKLMSRLGVDLSQEQLRRMMDGLDADKSGCIDKDEFTQWYADYSLQNVISEEEFAKFMFRVFDTTGSGELTLGEFKKKLEIISNRFTMDEIGMLVYELDSDNSGTICEEEFEHLIHKYYPKELEAPTMPCY